MRAQVHVDAIRHIGERETSLEVYVLDGAVTVGMVIENTSYTVQNVSNDETVSQHQTGAITVAGKEYVDVTAWEGTNLLLRSPYWPVDLKDRLVERWQEWRRKRQEDSQQLKEA